MPCSVFIGHLEWVLTLFISAPMSDKLDQLFSHRECIEAKDIHKSDVVYGEELLHHYH